MLAEQQGYLWRGLLYYDRCLAESEDLTGDGIDDQVFLSRGWATQPNIAFLDGARRTFYAEHRLPNAPPHRPAAADSTNSKWEQARFRPRFLPWL